MRPTIAIGYLPVLDHLTLGVAQRNTGRGFAHYMLKTKAFSRWPSIARAFRNGTIDGAFLLFPLALDLFRSGVDSRVVLLGHREGQVLVLGNDVRTVQELKGRTISIPDLYSTHHILLSKMLARAGVAMSDVRLRIGYNHINDVLDDLAHHTTQAFIIAEPLGTVAKRRKIGTIVALSNDIERHHIDCVLVVRKSIIDEHPDACQELVAALVKAGMFINAYPRQAAEIGESFLRWPRKILLEALTHDQGHILYWDLLPRIEDVNNLQTVAVRDLHLWKKIISLDSFIEPRFAQHAYREWMIDLRRTTKDKGEARTLPGNFEECIRRVQAVFHEFSAVGLHAIDAGQKYPKTIERIKEVREPYSTFLHKALSGKSYCIESMTPGTKALVVFTPGIGYVPDRVLFILPLSTALQWRALLTFGLYEMKTFPSYDDNTAAGDLITTQRKIVMLQHGADVWCSLEYQTFLLVVLVLQQQGSSAQFS